MLSKFSNLICIFILFFSSQIFGANDKCPSLDTLRHFNWEQANYSDYYHYIYFTNNFETTNEWYFQAMMNDKDKQTALKHLHAALKEISIEALGERTCDDFGYFCYVTCSYYPYGGIMASRQD